MIFHLARRLESRRYAPPHCIHPATKPSHTYGGVPQLPYIVVVADELAHRLVRQVVALNELELTVMLPHT